MRSIESRAKSAKTTSAVLLLGLVAACSGGGSATVTGTASGGDFLVKDAPVTELVSFRATVEELRLLGGPGGLSANLLSAPARVEFLGLQTVGAWLSSVDLPQGNFSACRLVFDGGTLAARAKDGSVVPVTATSTSMDIGFASTLAVSDDGGYHRILVDLDLEGSLSGDTLAMTFDPSGSVSVSDGSEDQTIDEFRGVVQSIDQAAGRVVLDAFADDDLSAPLGQVAVDVMPGAMLVKEDGTLFADSAAFFAAMQAGLSLLEVHGELSAAGAVDADKIELEDQNAGGNVASDIKIEGLLVNVNAGDFDLMIMEIEKGEALAQPVLDGIGNPGTITVSHDGSTVFFHEDGTPALATDLAVGQKVKAYFQTFTASPFPAVEIRVHDAPRAEAVITDISGLPGSIVVHIDDDEPWVLSGDVPTSTTDVTVDLTGATLWIKAGVEPAITASQLLVGLEVKLHGSLAALTVSASDLRVRPGRLEGTVSAMPSSSSLSMTLDNFKDPFGDPVDQLGPYTVVLDPLCEFEGVADGPGLKALFDGLLPGESLLLEIEGVGTGNANEILVYELEAEVETP